MPFLSFQEHLYIHYFAFLYIIDMFLNSRKPQQISSRYITLLLDHLLLCKFNVLRVSVDIFSLTSYLWHSYAKTFGFGMVLTLNTLRSSSSYHTSSWLWGAECMCIKIYFLLDDFCKYPFAPIRGKILDIYSKQRTTLWLSFLALKLNQYKISLACI